MMNVTVRIAFRNLFRQKMRNILLAIGVGFGMMVLVITQSYTEGFTDILLNRFVARVFGHIQVGIEEKIVTTVPVIRDRDQVVRIINNTLDDVAYCWESVSSFTRSIGNGAGSFMAVLGIEKNNYEFLESLKVIGGDVNVFIEEKVENPLIICAPKAEELNVRTGDVVKVRMITINGQVQSGRLTVAAVVKPENIFMTMAGFVPLENLKELMGYRPWETSRINIVLNHVSDPKETAEKADRLHKALIPEPATLLGTLQVNGKTADTVLLGLRSGAEKTGIVKGHLKVVAGDMGKMSEQAGMLLGRSIAEMLDAKIGDRIGFKYKTRFEGMSTETFHRVAAVVTGDESWWENAAFLCEKRFYGLYYENLPENPGKYPATAMHFRKSPLHPVLSPSFELMDRPESSKDWRKMMERLRRTGWTGQRIYVTSMQEIADNVFKIELALKAIGTTSVTVLFFIVLIGIVNTLNMAIRERTREIGTVRSIGMQRRQVLVTIVMETVFLVLFASIAGIVAALISMHILAGISFQVDNMFSILLDNGHLHFIPKLRTIVADVVFIVVIMIITAYFPAKKAASLPASEALRHYE